MTEAALVLGTAELPDGRIVSVVLAIMELFGVHDGIVTVKKIDRVQDEEGMLGLAADDIREFTCGTFLVKPRARSGAFSLPVDRAFTISCFGTVVTGTAYNGAAHPSDRVEVLPSSREGRIRTLHVHRQNVESAFAGQRVEFYSKVLQPVNHDRRRGNHLSLFLQAWRSVIESKSSRTHNSPYAREDSPVAF